MNISGDYCNSDCCIVIDNGNYEDEKDTYDNLINLFNENNNIKDTDSGNYCVFIGEQQQETVNDDNALFESHANATNNILF